MPQSAGSQGPALPRRVQKKVFVGRGKLEIPALQNSNPSRLALEANCSSSTADNGPPLPCCSTPQSCFSSSKVTPEYSSNLSLHSEQPSSRSECVTNNASIQDRQFRNGSQANQVSSLQSVVIGYSKKPTKEDFVCPSKDEDTTHLPGPTLTPGYKKVNPNGSGLNGSRKKYGVDRHTLVRRNERRGSVGSIPCTFYPVEPASEDFVRDDENRSPPPDFVDSDFSPTGLQTLSSQPDLSVMLSGAVKKSMLLKRRRDFIPTAVMPVHQLRAKSRSLSDLSKQKDKARRFLDRRNVIQMNPDDEECCSHTEVAPSSMMTLAMELLVARQNKAAALFNDAKKKSEEVACDADSILPTLWVVPKAPSPDSASKTASHLKPVLKDREENKEKTSTTPKLERCAPPLSIPRKELRTFRPHTKLNREEVQTPVESHGTVVMRKKNRKSPVSTTRCVALSEQGVEYQHDTQSSQCTGEEEIRPEDVERDLNTLTVADLFGSPDTVYTDTESEFETLGHTQPISTNKNQVVKIQTPAADQRFATISNAHKSSIDNVEKRNFARQESEHDLGHPFDLDNITPTMAALETNLPAKLECERKSSSVSESSSLTTVSSLSLSSNSMTSLDLIGGKDSFKPFVSSRVGDSDGDNESLATHDALALGTPSKQESGFEEETIPVVKCDGQSGPNTTPCPPRRSKSFGIMDKIRSKKFGKEGLGRGKWSEYRNAVKLTDGRMDFRLSRRSEADASPEECRSGVSSMKNSSVLRRGHSLQSTRDDEMRNLANIRNSTHEEPTDAQRGCRQQYPIFIEQDAAESSCGRSEDDTHGKTDRVPSRKKTLQEGECINCARNTNNQRTNQLPSQKSYHEPGDCLTSSKSVICHKCTDRIGMDTTKSFRGGEISVIGGSRVTLARNCKADVTEGRSNQSGGGIYLQDIVAPECELTTESSESPSEDTIVAKGAMMSESAQDFVSTSNEKEKSGQFNEKDPKVPQQKGITRRSHSPANQGELSGFIGDDVVAASPSSVHPHPGRTTALRTRSLHDLGSPSEEFASDSTSAQHRVGSTSEQAFNRTATNRAAAPYERNSAIKLLTGQNLYKSSVKISLNPAKSKENVKRECGERAVKMDHSRTTKHKREQKFGNVREVDTKEMKVTEKHDVANPELPAHSAVDEGDFAGVVDGPTKNVKEIRAMFKGPDYADYAKPRSLSKKQTVGQAHPISAEDLDEANLRNEKTTQNANRNSAEVAQHVIGLFKGALTLEKDANVPLAQTDQQDTATHNGTANTDEPKISIKDKVASFNSGRSPVKDAEINNNSNPSKEEETTKSNVTPVQSERPKEVVTNPEPETNGDAKKTAVKQEKVNAESYDESLDQFYDVLEELTTS